MEIIVIVIFSFLLGGYAFFAAAHAWAAFEEAMFLHTCNKLNREVIKFFNSNPPL